VRKSISPALRADANEVVLVAHVWISFPFPLHPHPVWWQRQVYLYTATGSMELSSDGSSWYSFSKA